MIYLLDTNVWVQFLRNRNALVVQRIHAHQPSEIRVRQAYSSGRFTGCGARHDEAMRRHGLRFCSSSRMTTRSLRISRSSTFISWTAAA